MAITDMKYTGLPMERFNVIISRYTKFQETCNDLSQEPVKVFDPLPKKSLDELYLIREVSKDLQKKKEEDVKKAAQAAAEQREEKAAEEKQDEGKQDGGEKEDAVEKQSETAK